MINSPYHRTISPTGYQTWTDPIDDYLNDILKDSKTESTKHYRMGVYCYRCRNLWQIPSICIPMAMSPLTQTFKNEYWISYLTMCAFIISGFCSSILAYFDYRKKSEKT